MEPAMTNQQSSNRFPKLRVEINIMPNEPGEAGPSSEPRAKIEIKIDPDENDVPAVDNKNKEIKKELKREIKEEDDFYDVNEELLPTADNVIKWAERQVKRERVREQRGQTDTTQPPTEPCMVPWTRRRQPKRGRRSLWLFDQY